MASLLRTLVDEALEKRGTTLTQFVEERLAVGVAIDALTEQLNYVTGVQITSRTLRRWTES